MVSPFHFYTRITQVELLGRTARNVKELAGGMEKVPSSSIYHHTHRYLEQHRHFSPEHPNDFSYWITTSLGLKRLGERIASVDLFSFKDMDDLRKRFIEILQDYLRQTPHLRNCLPAEEFHFLSSRIFIFPTPFYAHNVGEFVSCLEKISIHSLYFHMFEARTRLKRGDNDFSYWLRHIGLVRSADTISRIDPYTITMEGLRKRIISLLRREL